MRMWVRVGVECERKKKNKKSWVYFSCFFLYKRTTRKAWHEKKESEILKLMHGAFDFTAFLQKNLKFCFLGQKKKQLTRDHDAKLQKL